MPGKTHYSSSFFYEKLRYNQKNKEEKDGFIKSEFFDSKIY
ncbi:hypothetical protein LEP1GSC071_0095 [Leptospira santarosai str. JET]|nr:hypothetical protein LEP1GSC071_0095 [Leptospira santarosai str. JET]